MTSCTSACCCRCCHGDVDGTRQLSKMDDRLCSNVNVARCMLLLYTALAWRGMEILTWDVLFAEMSLCDKEYCSLLCHLDLH